MNEKYIFNYDGKIYLKNILNAGKITKASGYEFVLFNDIVYFVDAESYCHRTEITKNDLVSSYKMPENPFFAKMQEGTGNGV